MHQQQASYSSGSAKQGCLGDDAITIAECIMLLMLTSSAARLGSSGGVGADLTVGAALAVGAAKQQRQQQPAVTQQFIT